jgi:hypothetical protein
MVNDDTPINKKFLGIIPSSKTYYFINGELIESNNIAD